MKSTPRGGNPALYALSPTEVVAPNRGVVLAEVAGPAAALAFVDGLDLGHYHLFHATRADLLRRLGRAAEAATAYRTARVLTANPVEQSFLETQLSTLTNDR
jgi:RNA polymerase sigma-70 factor (ECF subfamily)